MPGKSSTHAADSHSLIRVQGARENNLKDVSVELPKRRLTAFTGLSWCGKSFLVFDTLAAESQRMINETYSAFVQGFNALDQWGRFDEASAALRKWGHEGRINARQTVFEGIESCVDALNGLFTGANIGKMLVKLSEPTT